MHDVRIIANDLKMAGSLHNFLFRALEHWTTFDAIESGASFDQGEEEGPFSSDYVLICGAHFGRSNLSVSGGDHVSVFGQIRTVMDEWE